MNAPPPPEYENHQVLRLVQALLGSVTQNFRAVALSVDGRRVALRFLLQDDDRDDREEIEEIAFSFTSLQEDPLSVDVEVEVAVDSRPFAECTLVGRLVYLRREFS